MRRVVGLGLRVGRVQAAAQDGHARDDRPRLAGTGTARASSGAHVDALSSPAARAPRRGRGPASPRARHSRSRSTIPDQGGPLVTVMTRGGECPDGACGSATVIARDGQVHQIEPVPADLGEVPPAILTALDAAIKTADFDAIRAVAFTGECPVNFDGQEVVYEFAAPSGVERIASCETEVDPDHPLVRGGRRGARGGRGIRRLASPDCADRHEDRRAPVRTPDTASQGPRSGATQSTCAGQGDAPEQREPRAAEADEHAADHRRRGGSTTASPMATASPPSNPREVATPPRADQDPDRPADGDAPSGTTGHRDLHDQRRRLGRPAIADQGDAERPRSARHPCPLQRTGPARREWRGPRRCPSGMVTTIAMNENGYGVHEQDRRGDQSRRCCS